MKPQTPRLRSFKVVCRPGESETQAFARGIAAIVTAVSDREAAEGKNEKAAPRKAA